MVYTSDPARRGKSPGCRILLSPGTRRRAGRHRRLRGRRGRGGTSAYRSPTQTFMHLDDTYTGTRGRYQAARELKRERRILAGIGGKPGPVPARAGRTASHQDAPGGDGKLNNDSPYLFLSATGTCSIGGQLRNDDATCKEKTALWNSPLRAPGRSFTGFGEKVRHGGRTGGLWGAVAHSCL